MDMFIRCSDGTVFKLSELKESTAKEWVLKMPNGSLESNVSEITDMNDKNATSYIVDSYNRFVFRDGQLVGCHFTGNVPFGQLSQAQIGVTTDGEFLAFPIQREDLFRLFGKPKEIRKSRFRPPN
jgi:hypothetical protein